MFVLLLLLLFLLEEFGFCEFVECIIFCFVYRFHSVCKVAIGSRKRTLFLFLFVKGIFDRRFNDDT
jgi:hypothetical protein